jgi:hypothetical protein
MDHTLCCRPAINRDGPEKFSSPPQKDFCSILVYCGDYSIAMSADRWPDDVRLSDIEPRFVCKACGKRGADVRPHFEPAKIGTVW